MDQPRINTLEDLLRNAAGVEPATVLLVMPKGTETYLAVGAARATLRTRFVLVGDRGQIESGLTAAGTTARDGIEIQHHPGPVNALTASVEILKRRGASILMKGGIDTGTMMRAVFNEDSGLKTGKIFSDVAITELPPASGGRLLMITDGGLAPAPDLKEKIALIQNAVAVAHALGNPLPRVALLSATELVSPAIPSTTDAAILSKMNDRGQIGGCIVDGPLALDNAVSPEAAREKGIRSEVAGRADIIVAPSIETANALAKSATYFAGWRMAHVVVGGTVPILIPSRADTAATKLLSIALGTLMARSST